MSDFRTELRRARLACFVAQLACGLGWWLAVMASVAVLVALCDWGFVLSEGVRAQLLQPAMWLGGVLLLPVVWQAVVVARRLPSELDSLNADPRCTVSSALRLPKPNRGTLADWLTGRALQQAATAVRSAREHSPALRRWMLALLVPVLAAGALIGLYCASPAAFSTLAARLLLPHEDVPPYSPYRFTLTPAEPQVHFGEDITLACRVTGAPAPAELNLLLRSEGMPVQALPVFVARDGSYMRVLEHVTAPCEVAFATPDGRARSHFVPLKVNYSPRILSGRATVTPMAYTGEPPREHVLGGSEISVPDGGTVAFELQCSSEIVSGYGLFTPAGESEAQRLPARAEGKALHLSLPLRTPGSLMLQVCDSAGREADAPVHIRLAVQPDAPPTVAISTPEDGSYLVVGQPLKMELKAEDDYALNRLTLFKALAPYRQHGVSELQGRPRSQTVARSYDSAALGLNPGDVLELRAEVGDDNPFRFNIVSTPTTRVNVISAEQYAEILRLEITYDEFMARYELLTEALAQAVQALKEGDAAAARTAMESARELSRTIAGDFPVFDMDGKLSELAGRIADELDSNLAELGTLGDGGSDSERREAFDRMLSRLGEPLASLAQEEQQAVELALVARAQEAQHRFAELVQQQAELVGLYRRFMDEFGAASTSEPGRLEGLGVEQVAILQEYVAWEESLSPLLAELGQHESLASLYQQVFAMRHACEQAGVEGLMDQAVAESSAHHPAEAHSYAAQALDGMEKLLQNECSARAANDAAGQCRSSMASAAGNTLQQLLDAMLNRRRENSAGRGEGSGRGQSTRPRAAVGNRLIGPARSRMSRRAGSGNSSAKAGADRPGESAAQHSPQLRPIGTPGPESPTYRDIDTQMVPPTYRDAVRSYFSH
ncbi:MAG: hypothetical protein IJ943_06560 [Akkermansia sp.]|nr:hypothetical protein [Akkermansia sp.]